MSDGYCDNKLLYQKCHEALIKHSTGIQFIFENGDNVVKIPSNKAVLAAASPVFNAMFNGALKEKGDVKITDVSSEAFREFLQFFYDSQVKLTMKNISEVLKLADKYDVADCLPVCSNFLKENVKVDDILWALHLAVQFNLDDLETFCEEEINQNHKTVFDMINFENGRLRVASNNRLLDNELDNILPYVFTISKNISSQKPENLEPQLLPVTLVSTKISTSSTVGHHEEIEFSLNQPMMLAEIKFSDIVILSAHSVATYSVEMSIHNILYTMGGEKWTQLYNQNVVIKGGIEKTHIKLQPPLRIEQTSNYRIRFLSDHIPKGLCTQKANIPDDPIELAPNVRGSEEKCNVEKFRGKIFDIIVCPF